MFNITINALNPDLKSFTLEERALVYTISTPLITLAGGAAGFLYDKYKSGIISLYKSYFSGTDNLDL